jgi:SAM-dependent methyltransferase
MPVSGAGELPLEYDYEKYVGHPSNHGLRNFSEAEARFHYQAHGHAEGRVCGAIDGRAAFLGLVPPDRSLLEIGPFCTPAFRAPAHQVAYLDAFTTDELREQARGMAWADPARVPEIDFVWKGEKYRELIGREFDVVFSSHNVEHQPCLVTHLAEVASVLRPDGRFLLAIPDKRYCFDHFLPESTITDVLDAFLSERRDHAAKNVVQGRLMHTHNEARRHWQGDHGDDPRARAADDGLAASVRQVIAEYRSRTGYLDAHAWQFTPASLRHLARVLARAGLVNLTVERVYETLNGSNEFYAVLARS